MNFITKVVIQCNQQQDATGSDDIKVIRNNSDVLGSVTIQSGQTQTILPGRSISNSIDEQGFLIDPGDSIKVFESDLFDADDLLLDYIVAADDISNGSVTLSDSADDADYNFTFFFQ
jgi:hypothetical protein